MRELFRKDILLQWRQGFWLVYFAISIIYIIILFNIPMENRMMVSLIMILSDTTMLGVIFIGALILLEKQQLVTHSLFITPLHPSHYIWSKTISLSLIAIAMSILVYLPVLHFSMYTLLLFFTIAFTAAIFVMFGIGIASKVETINQYFVITAISVTPTGKSGYLELRLGIPLVLSLVFVLLFQVLLHLTGPLGFLHIILISALISTQALLLLLFLGAFADNKVMGMAISKGFGILLLGPVLDYLLPDPYNWLGTYSPLFWASRAFLVDNPASFWLYFGIATIFHGLLIWILFRKFVNRSD